MNKFGKLGLAKKARQFGLILFMAITALCVAPPAPAASYHSTPGVYINGSTNVITVGALTNVQVSTVSSGTNVYFNMPGATATNLWPALELDDPKSLDHFQTLLFGAQFGLSAAGSYTNVFKIAVSPDNWAHTISNYCIITLTGTQSSLVQTYTNLNLGAFRFAALQEIDCVNTNSGSMTNLVIYPPVEKDSL